MQPGTRFWRVMKYLSALIFSSAVLLVAMEWNGYPASQPPQPPPQAAAESKPEGQNLFEEKQEALTRVRPDMWKDIDVWTYTPEFSKRFGMPELPESGPSGAYAVAFQVRRVEDLDLCVLDGYLENHMPIDYPEGEIGFMPFAYPMSWAFLKLTPQDGQMVDRAYLSKYKDIRAFIRNEKGEQERLLIFKYRKHLYEDVAYLSFTLPCDRVPALGARKAVLHIRTSSGGYHSVLLSRSFLERVQTYFTGRRRKEAALVPDTLRDINVWTYTSEFARRFGFPELKEPGPTGAQAVAFRVQLDLDDHERVGACLLDVFIDDKIDLSLPEGNVGFMREYPESDWFLERRTKATADQRYRMTYLDFYRKPIKTEWLKKKEITSLWEWWQYRNAKKLEGNFVRTGYVTPLDYLEYRKHALPGLSYLAFDIGCATPTHADRGLVEVRIEKTDGTKHQIELPKQYLKRLYENYRVREEIPHEIRLFGKPLEPQP